MTPTENGYRMQIETWLLYFTAIIIVIAIPGPLSLLMVNSTLKQGIRASTPVLFGGSLASSVLLIISASGLGAIVVSSELLFNIIRYAGAAYLLYLGIQLIQPSSEISEPTTETNQASHQTSHQISHPDKKMPLFHQAFLMGISNPKDILFFIALLPQFVDPQKSLLVQLTVIVGSWFIADCLCKLSYGLAAKSVSGLFTNPKNQRRLDFVSATLFIGVAIGAML
ncbi:MULTISPECIES: LysE family translocator [unclassified Oleiphilus]|uniref:LysE family translocator n=1 Tax=unclassified Oleiphilus TaxID=2631174 RepID=UPI0009EDC258|nr:MULTISPECIES: LysE family translocator [unclassified Oleiphilus]